MLNNTLLEEGYKPVAILLLITLMMYIFDFGCLGNLFLLFTLATIFIFRNRSKHIYANTNSVLSPVDGKIIAIDNTDNMIKIYCKTNLCNNHIVRAPVDGEIVINKFRNGLNLDPNSYKAKTLNEQVVFMFDDIEIRMMSGLCNSSIEHPTSKIYTQGEAISVFLDGLTIISIKNSNKLLIDIGDKISAGQTILFKK